ncbi:DMT family transporter [Thermaerobacillus caldiproteolyticus]|uniref:Drug/metabolite transporter (DMT)-like permease n=1 Tax=Thermaerobacillus caldiproteolyticus TaxID=247480 RepID=A0A7W0BYZ1_9BACL|nr:EamA family transporter [Anoxybacillus caldiproteolyticus]MBA2876216.1 drug/metabolite transporter (DMT)-like permease [Anoxybacillus caldiproteolyticus]
MKKPLDLSVIGAHGLIIFLWGSAFAGIRVGLEAYTPAHLSLLRLLVGSAALIVFAFIIRMRLPDLKDIPSILLLGFLGFAVYHTALNIGEKTVSAGAASLIVSTTPIFTAPLALIFFREGLGICGWIGAIISFSGVTLISLGTGDQLQLNSGALLILLASFSESLYFVFQKFYLKKYRFLEFTTYTIWAGTFFMLVFLPGLGEAMIKAPMEVTLSVVYLGLFPTVLPYFALAYITSRVGSSEATTSLYLTPTVAFVIAWIWLGEIPTILSLIGGVITLLGILLSSGWNVGR